MKSTVRPDVIQLGARRLRAGPAEPAEARARLSDRGGAAGGGGAGAAGVRHGRGGPRQDVARRRADPPRRGQGRRAAALGARLGRRQHARPGAARTRGPRARPRQVDALVAKLRVYAISDQDDAGPWIRREFPALHYVATPSTQDGEQYYLATWTGISGDRFYRNAPGADFTTFTDDWVNANIRSKGPLGQALSASLLHPRGRHAVVPRADRQRAGERDEPGLRRLGRPLRLAPAFRRDAPVLDAGRRLVPGPRQLARHRRRAPTARPTRPTRPRSGAGGRRSSTTSPRAWTGRSRTPASANHNPRGRGERPRGHGAARARRAGRRSR